VPTNPGLYGKALARWQAFMFAEGGMWARLIGRNSRAALVAETYSALKALFDISPIIHSVREEPD
jgi:hypothetical protein